MKNRLWLIILGIVVLLVLFFHFFLSFKKQEPVEKTIVIETQEIIKPKVKEGLPQIEVTEDEETIEGEVTYEESDHGPIFLN